MKKSIKNIIFKNTVIIFSSIMFLILTVIGFSFKTLSQINIENEITSISDAVKAGLTSHMKAEIMDKKDYFIQEISTLHNINNLRVTPSYELLKQYGKESEFRSNKREDLVFISGKTNYEYNSFEIKPEVKATIPYIATKEGTLNCLQCHMVKEGTVLGVVEFDMDFSRQRNMTLLFISLVIVILFIFMLITAFKMNKSVEKEIIAPLKNIIQDGEESFKKSLVLEKKEQSSIELDELAQELSLFSEEIIKTQVALHEKNVEVEKSLVETAQVLGRIESYRSEETRNHTKRVSEYARVIGEKIGLSEKDIKDLSTASALHDIGKLGIPEDILHKNGKLTDEEFEIMKKHTEIGYDMLIHSNHEFLQIAAAIALQHHEKHDGTGYPYGLTGDSISIYAKIVAVIDVFDALTMERSYKKAWSIEESVALIRREKGKHFDPQIVDIFLENLEKIIAIREEYNH